MHLLHTALRALRAQPLFSSLVIGLLALGIGANTAIFGVVHAVLLKPLPYPAPGELVLIRKPPRDGNTAAMPGGGALIVDKDLGAWIEAQPKSFRALAGYSNATSTLQQTGGTGAIRVPTGRVTLGFFPLLGVSAWRGRLLQEEDFKSGATPVAVLSYSAWQSRFNGNDQVIGAVVQLDEVAHTVIGVLPPAFEFIDPVQFWRPLPLSGLDRPGQLQISMVRALGRLLPGTTHEIAQRELDGISERFWDNYSTSFSAGMTSPAAAPAPSPSAAAAAPAGGSVTRIVQTGPPPAAEAAAPRRLAMPFVGGPAQLTLLQEQLAQQSRTTLWLLLGAVGFVLLIACANIANLQLARAASRRRAAAVRAALGASPARLAGELLAENLLLALAGGALGLLLAWWGTQALQAWLADFLPRVNPISVDLTVLGYALLMAVVAGIGFGLAPAWQTSRVDLLETLKDGGPQASAGGSRWRQGLVAFEVALALVLAVNTGLLVKSIYHLYSTELGYRTEDVMSANLSLPRRYAAPAQQREFAQRWLEVIRALPGVKSAAIADTAPLSPFSQVFSASIRGGTGGANRSVNSPPPTMQIASVTPDYFATAGIALKSGRFFTEADGDGAPIVALVNEEFIKQNFPDGLRDGATIIAPISGSPKPAAIVGVVANVRARGLDSQPSALAYFPLAQVPRQRLSALVQFTGDSAPLARGLVQATHKVDAELALDTPATLAQQIARQTAPRRVTLMLTGAFAATALLLAALGIFGVMSYTVTQRTQEIGVRMALGADTGTIMRWILGYGGVAIAAGLAAGLGLTFATSQLLSTFLVGITALDPVVLTVGIAALGLAGLGACWLPARRATRVNPVEALRAD